VSCVKHELIIIPSSSCTFIYIVAPDCSWEKSVNAADQYYRLIVKGNSMDDQLFRSRREPFEEERCDCQATEVWREASRLVNGIRMRDWDRWIDLYLLALRSARHETTKISPAEMCFGRELKLPLDLLRGISPQKFELEENNYVTQLRKKSTWDTWRN